MSERIPCQPSVQQVGEASAGVSIAEASKGNVREYELGVPVVASEVDAPAVVTRGTSIRERFHRSRAGRIVMSGLSALGLAAGGVVIDASPAVANPVYTVVNPDNDGTRSIYDRNSPHWNDTTRTYPDFSYYGDRLELICGTNGDAIGPYNNKRWHYAKNLSRPEAGVTWIPDRYMNTPNKANQPTPGEKECGAQAPKPPAPVPAAKACYFNLKAPSKNLTFSYGGNHRYLGNAWQGAKNWTDAGAGISIRQTSANNAYIRFKDVNVTRNTVIDGVVMSGGTVAKAIVPDEDTTFKTVPSNPRVPKAVTILLNRHIMDGLNDFQRTYTTTHEIGHALGFAHTEKCGHTNKSIMNQGSKTDGVLQRNFNTPLNFDKAGLKQLYN